MKKKLCAFAMAAVMAAVLLAGCGSSKDAEDFEWSDLVMSEYLPEPPQTYGEIINDSKNHLTVYLYKESEDDYETYLEACQDAGYTVVTQDSDNYYTAYNSAGYKLSLDYYEDDKEIQISLASTKIDGTFDWPTKGLATLLPKPGSDTGTVTSDDSDYLTVYVGDFSAKQYKNYVNKCMDAGFTVDYSKNDNSFYADDESGNSLTLKYVEGIQMMIIDVIAGDDEDASSSQSGNKNKKNNNSSNNSNSNSSNNSNNNNKNTDNASDDDADSLDSDFRDFVDSYEEFMDEYCEFMEEYYDSDDVTGMLDEYTEMMSQYAEFVEEYESVDTDSLSDDDYQYYLDAQLRVTEKLNKLADSME